MAKIIDGKKISAEIKEELKTEVAAYAAQGKKCALAVIQVGADPTACRSSAVTGLPSNVYATIIRPRRLFKSFISSARHKIAIISDATVITK